MEIEESARSRELSGFVGWLAKFVLIALPVSGIFFLFNLPQQIGWLVLNEQYLGLFLALALCATFLLIPAGKWDKTQRAQWNDLPGRLLRPRLAGKPACYLSLS